jgi:hypothetical protein
MVTDPAEEVFLEVELADTWPLCLEHFEDLCLSVRALFRCLEHVGRSYFHRFCHHLVPLLAIQLRT